MDTRAAGQTFILKPEEHDAIKKEARKILKAAKAIGVFPTPIEKLMEAANIEQIAELEEIKESFLKQASASMAAAFISAWPKLRGFADLKRKVTYVAPDTPIREIWPKLHELGHQVLPWQQINLAYMDDQKSLSQECEDRFDQEANDFAGEVLFQGDTFKDVSSSLYPDFDTILTLADKFGASKHATARHFAEQSDEPTALVSYHKSYHGVGLDGRPAWVLGRASSASEKFINKYPNLRLPTVISSSHEWAKAIDEGKSVNGSQMMDCGDGTTASFLWNSWWNHYSLLVLIRKTPRLKIVTDIFK